MFRYPLSLILILLIGAPAWAQQLRPISVREADGKKVERIRFVYRQTKALKSKELRNAMRIQEGERFSRRFLNSDLSTIVNFYRGKGYREAEIVGRKLAVDGDDHLHITIELDSGVQWTVGQVHIAGGAPFTPEFLLAQIDLRPGAVLDYAQVLAGERDLQIFLNRRGYPHASVRNDWVDDLAHHSADVTYYVDAGRKMYFGEITIENEEQLHTRRKLIVRYITFDRGDLFDPEKLARSRNELARTGLFRSVFFATPQVGASDSLQPIHLRLQERKYIGLGANAFLNVAQSDVKPRISGTVQHNNWLGRGAQLGLDASWGQPFQGATLYMTERDLLRTGADLTLSAGLSEKWGSTEVFADPNDPLQFDLLTTNDSVLEGLLIFGGEDNARQYIQTVVYDYTSIERLMELSGALTRRWRDRYQANLSITWTRARTRPDPKETIKYTPSDLVTGATGEEVDDGSDGGIFDDDDFGFDDEDFGFADDDFGFDDEETPAGEGDATYIDYSDGSIPIDPIWKEILTERSRSINFSTEFQRDARDDRIAPTRGSFLRLTGLYAIKLGSRSTYVVDGEIEVRRYQRLSDHFVLAVAAQGGQTGSLRKGRPLPQIYWKLYGGDGSLRGVDPNAITAVGGGRTGLNLRGELRFQASALGLVGFWDRAQVWRHARDATLGDLFAAKEMVDGYGLGLRYVVGFPFRFDLAFNDGFDKDRRMRFYFSIGQAF